MSEDEDDVSKLPSAPRKSAEWGSDPKGRPTLFGTWADRSVSQYVINNPNWHTVEELAARVYGRKSDSNCARVRKNIVSLRKYMLYMLQQPFITEYYRPRKIKRIKLYNHEDDYDRIVLGIELQQALDQKDITDKKCEELRSFFRIAAPPRTIQ